MNRQWLFSAKILTGICAVSMSSFSQTYTVSAKPGALNFIQGEVSVNGDPVWKANLRSTFLKENDVLAVENGKAEVLLTPGVFLRVGDHSQVRMLKPSLIETQLEITSGESMLEVDDLQPGSDVVVSDHGSSTTISKPGLFRFNEHTIASLDGKAEVSFGGRKTILNKDREVQIDDALHATKVDLNQPDELYAWSNTRALTNAAASYAGSTSVYNSGGYGYSSYNSPGWYWANGFNSYMWLPGNGAFYSPFGWGFYGPGVVAYAPVVYSPYGFTGGYGYGSGSYYPILTGVKGPVATTTKLPVPVNPQGVGASVNAMTPAALQQARIVNQNYANFYGLQTAKGSAPAVLRSGQVFASMQQASHAAESSSRAVASSGSSSGFHANSAFPTLASAPAASSSGSFGGGSASHGGGASSSGGHSSK